MRLLTDIHHKRWWTIALFVSSIVCFAGMALRWHSLQQRNVDPALRAFERHVYRDKLGPPLPYRLLRPAGSNPHHRYPLILFLHGLDTRGEDNTAQVLGLGRFFLDETFHPRYACFVVVPQCPVADRWAHADHYFELGQYRLLPDPGPTMRQTLALLEALPARYAIDPDRVYVIGYSMGGVGVWDAICREPERFAAAVPFCGRADLTQASRLTTLPLWVFHGALDDNIEVAWSRNMVAAIRKAGGHPRYTEAPQAGHDCWSKALADPSLFTWLFAQSRRQRQGNHLIIEQ